MTAGNASKTVTISSGVLTEVVVIRDGDWNDEISFEILYDGNIIFQHPIDQEFEVGQILGTFTVNPSEPEP